MVGGRDDAQDNERITDRNEKAGVGIKRGSGQEASPPPSSFHLQQECQAAMAAKEPNIIPFKR